MEIKKAAVATVSPATMQQPVMTLVKQWETLQAMLRNPAETKESDFLGACSDHLKALRAARDWLTGEDEANQALDIAKRRASAFKVGQRGVAYGEEATQKRKAAIAAILKFCSNGTSQTRAAIKANVGDLVSEGVFNSVFTALRDLNQIEADRDGNFYTVK